MERLRTLARAAIAEACPDRAAAIRADFDARCDRLAPEAAAARRSANPLDRRLDAACDFLALAQALEAAGVPDEAIRERVLAVAHALVAPRNRLHAWLKRMTPRLLRTALGRPLIALLARRAAVQALPGGFRARILTDPAETLGLGFGVDILDCGICGLYTRHGGRRFAAILCEVDRVTTALAGLEMRRTGTIANGAACCDFRYRLREPGEAGA